MDPFNNKPSPNFHYSHKQPDTMVNDVQIHGGDTDTEFSGVLEIYIHHARNIHNICIYEDQDVYAKFSLTCNPDETLSTTIILGGGKNPEFNESLGMKIRQKDAVLKCEIWMLSRARNYMEDQLLGFVLVPLAEIHGRGKVTSDYGLSSTDLFHSPAGTVRLSLSLLDTTSVDNKTNNSPPIIIKSSTGNDSSITSEVILLDRKVVSEATIEYSRIEFPDINVVRENQQMVSQYFDLTTSSQDAVGSRGIGIASFLHLGAHHHDDYETPNGSVSGFLSSTTTSLSDDRNSSADSIEKMRSLSNSSTIASGDTDTNPNSVGCSDTSTSKKGIEINNKSNFTNKDGQANIKEGMDLGGVAFGKAFSTPLGNINLGAEQQSAMQQQIVDMYMRSMQQFTESLAKMKLPMDLDNPEATQVQHHSSMVQTHNNSSSSSSSSSNTNNNNIEVEMRKKDGSRVFYGSRAFF